MRSRREEDKHFGFSKGMSAILPFARATSNLVLTALRDDILLFLEKAGLGQLVIREGSFSRLERKHAYRPACSNTANYRVRPEGAGGTLAH